MNKRQLGDVLADNWLAQWSAYDPGLIDIHERFLFNGTQCPVFKLRLWVSSEPYYVYVFRYLPLNSEVSRLAFLP